MARTSSGTTLKKSPNVYLTEAVGNKVTGVFQKKTESKLYPGKFSYLIAVEDTNAPIRIWDKETKTEKDVDITEGEIVFLSGSTLLDRAMADLGVKEGERITVEYTGKGVAAPGRKAPYKFTVTVH